eukprot:357154-Chlamydomonas_euryale.AAC.1
MCNKAPRSTPELQRSGFKAPMTSTPRGGVSPRCWGGLGRGCARLSQVTPGFRQLRDVVTPYASYATPLDELRPQTWLLRCRGWQCTRQESRGVGLGNLVTLDGEQQSETGEIGIKLEKVCKSNVHII